MRNEKREAIYSLLTVQDWGSRDISSYIPKRSSPTSVLMFSFDKQYIYIYIDKAKHQKLLSTFCTYSLRALWLLFLLLSMMLLLQMTSIDDTAMNDLWARFTKIISQDQHKNLISPLAISWSLSCSPESEKIIFMMLNGLKKLNKMIIFGKGWKISSLFPLRCVEESPTGLILSESGDGRLIFVKSFFQMKRQKKIR